MEEKSAIDISVIICCYNSQDRIVPTLEHLTKQDFGGKWEVILVDNNCTDNTITLARNNWRALESKIDLRIVSENQPGLSYARTRGVDAARSSLLLFCDDDNWLAPGYLSIAYDIMMRNPQVGVLGGNGRAEWEATPDSPEKLIGLAINPQGAKTGDITNDKGHVYGAGAVFRKAGFLQLRKMNFVSRLTDRRGNELSSGNDTELCYAFRLMNYRVYYSQEMKFSHYIPQTRITPAYLKKLRSGFLDSFIVLECYSNIIHYHYSSWRVSWSKALAVKLWLQFKRSGLKGIVRPPATFFELLQKRNQYRICFQAISHTFRDYI